MPRTPPLTILILAAGKGTRMKSDRAKVLHEVLFAPMIHHVLDAVQPLSPDQTLVVVGHQHHRVEAALGDYPVACVVQEQQMGTGHAVLAAGAELQKAGGTVLILCGDLPLIRPTSLQALLAAHDDHGGPLTVMTTRLDDPGGYGRVICDSRGGLVRIVEQRDASPTERQINEINAGIYCAQVDFLLTALDRVGSNNSQGEVYLTDIVAIANNDGLRVEPFHTADSLAVLGVNSRVDLARAGAELQRRYNRQLMDLGVTLLNPATVAIQKGIDIGPDSCIHPNVQINGTSRLGRGCVIEPSVVIDNCRIGDNVSVGPCSVLRNGTIPANTQLGPHTLLDGDG